MLWVGIVLFVYTDWTHEDIHKKEQVLKKLCVEKNIKEACEVL
jgi:hypothetical protein